MHYTREMWGARPAKSRALINVPTPELWLHHSVSKGDGPSIVRAIQNYHMDERGWKDIAYSFLIDANGDTYEGRGYAIAGGHTKNHNSKSHGICLIGNYNVATPSVDMIDALVSMVAEGYLAGKFPLAFTGGHRDADGASTTCPGQTLYDMIPDINRAIARRVEELTLMFNDIGHLPPPVQDDIEWAATVGITNGVGKGRFAPDAPVTRAQFVTMLRRALKVND